MRAAAETLAGLDLEVVILRNIFYKEYMLEITPMSIAEAKVLAVAKEVTGLNSQGGFGQSFLKYIPGPLAP